MKNNNFFILLLSFLLIFSLNSCKDDNGLPPSSEVNDFVWNAMNLWYYWQKDVPDLADDRFSSNSEFQNFIQGKQPDDLFYSLLFNYGNTDRFSWIVDNYHDLENSFANINQTFGIKYGLVYASSNSNEIFGFVQYVIPNSPAEQNGMKRGDIFTRINGTYLTDSNYNELLNNTSATFGMGKIEDGTLHDLNLEIHLNQVEIKENPVLLTKVIEDNGHKIGYLVYTNFRGNFLTDLNDAIGDFKAQGITDLVVDLRYNGGGQVQTCTDFAGMITGQFSGEEFSTLTFNEKTSNNNKTYRMKNTGKNYDDNLNLIGEIQLNQLNLNQLYVLTLQNTASASEMLISSLRPYIDVQTIGMKTYGKTVGSITLYDSPSNYYTSSDGINPEHTWAMQPIVFDYKNSQNQSSPTDGISPGEEINELQYLENLPPLGNPEEPLLGAAISKITGTGKSSSNLPTFTNGIYFKSSQTMDRFGTEMYLEKDFENIP